ncbi:hypothetical protein J7L70_00370 [Candidatus Bathyarchaeota archaeon]|nr:hypothetical protein [Candidatus Bathyarchaeota archaeon]
MDTFICHGLSWLLRGSKGTIFPLNQRYLIELDKKPDWQELVDFLLTNLQQILNRYQDIEALINERRKLGRASGRREEILDLLRGYTNTPGGRLHMALETQGAANARAALNKVKEALKEIENLDPDLSRVYTEDHALRYGEGRRSLSSASKRTVRVKAEKVKTFTAPLPVIGSAGKYATSLYGYRPDAVKVCPWDLALSWLGLCVSAAVIREGRGEGVTIITLRPALRVRISEIRLSQFFSMGAQMANTLPLAAAVVSSLSKVGGIRSFETEDEVKASALEKIEPARWSVIAYRFEQQQPRRPYAIRRISEYPAFRLLRFIKEARNEGVNLARIMDELIRRGDVDVLELMAESIIYGDLNGFASSVRAAFSSLSSGDVDRSRLLDERLAKVAVNVLSS